MRSRVFESVRMSIMGPPDRMLRGVMEYHALLTVAVVRTSQGNIYVRDFIGDTRQSFYRLLSIVNSLHKKDS